MDNQVNPGLAKLQWNKLKETYDLLGIEVKLLKPHPHVPDLVFTANAGLVKGKKAVLSNFRYPERQPEEKYNEEWFKENDFEVLKLDPSIKFEGEGDALFFQEKLVCGSGFRSDPQAATDIAKLLNIEAISVKQVDPRFYHIDLCFLPIENFIVYYPGAFDVSSQTKIKSLTNERFELTEEEALKFSTNSFVVDHTLIGPSYSERFLDFLKEKGYHTIQLDLSEFTKAGGGAKCLTLNLNGNN